MSLEILFGLIGALLSLALGGLIPLLERQLDRYGDTSVVRLLHRLGLFEHTDSGSFKAQMDRSLKALGAATNKIDEVFSGITKLAQERQSVITALEAQLVVLTTRESEIKAKIQTLEKVPIEAVRHFEDLLKKGDRRSASRDYVLFGLGVVVSTIVAIVLTTFGF